jgi:hypothetical protein
MACSHVGRAALGSGIGCAWGDYAEGRFGRSQPMSGPVRRRDSGIVSRPYGTEGAVPYWGFASVAMDIHQQMPSALS